MKTAMTPEQAYRYDEETTRKLLEGIAFKVREEDACRLPFRDCYFRIEAAFSALFAAIDEAEDLEAEYAGPDHPCPRWDEVLEDLDHVRYLARVARDFITCTVPGSWPMHRDMLDPVESAEHVRLAMKVLNNDEADEPAIVEGVQS